MLSLVALGMTGAVALAAPSWATMTLGMDAGTVTFWDATKPFVPPYSLGDATVGITLYPSRPLQDDGAPLTLQPFLQRLSTVSVTIGAGGNGSSDSNRYGLGTVAADIYLRPWFILGASLAFRLDGDSTVTEIYGTNPLNPFMQIPLGSVLVTSAVSQVVPRLDLGLRFGDVRIDLAYAPDLEWMGPSMVGTKLLRVYLDLRAVFARRYDLALGARALDGGGGGRVYLAGYVTDRLGLFASVDAQHGAIYNNTSANFDAASANAGVSYWFTRRVGGSASYQLNWSHQAGAPDGAFTLEHLGVLGLSLRIP